MLENLLGSRIRAELLRALFRGDGKRMHLHELARLTGLSAPSLMREAKAMVADGVLLTEHDANRTVYSANPQNHFYQPLVELVKRAEDPLELMRTLLMRAGDQIRVAFVYGSRAKGTARKGSDYDLFVIGRIGLRGLSAVLAPIRDKVGVELNPYVMAPADFAVRVKEKDHFLTDVLAGSKIFLKGGENELAAMEE